MNTKDKEDKGIRLKSTARLIAKSKFHRDEPKSCLQFTPPLDVSFVWLTVLIAILIRTILALSLRLELRDQTEQ
jgi:hypothetical protein